MSGSRVCRSAAALVAVVATVGFAGCGGRDAALGGGPEVDVCGGYRALDELPEPDPGDQRAVVEWADGFLRATERTETDLRITDRNGDRTEVPANVVTAVKTLERSITAFRAKARAAGGAAAMNAVADSLAGDAGYHAAHRRLRDFTKERCR